MKCTDKKHVCIGPPPTGHWKDVALVHGTYHSHAKWWRDHLKEVRNR